MKIVDQTPLYKENGELSWFDHLKAIMQFGSGWVKEMEAQKSVIAVLEKFLDNKYTLLRNLTPSGLEARIPLILVGPTGVYVMCITPQVGYFRARGDQWGTISGNTFKPGNPNLLTRTERMARAIHLFLQRQGYTSLINVEAVLLCSNPTTTVDSMRPIIRVIMRDALERFAVSVSQARIVLTPESAFDVVNRLLNPPPPPPEPVPVEPVAVVSATPPAQASGLYVPLSTQPESEAAPASAEPTAPPLPDAGPETTPDAGPETTPAAGPLLRFLRRITRQQWAILIGMIVIWFLIVVVFAFLIIHNLYPQLFIIK
jgi:hypothetical protein